MYVIQMSIQLQEINLICFMPMIKRRLVLGEGIYPSALASGSGRNRAVSKADVHL